MIGSLSNSIALSSSSLDPEKHDTARRSNPSGCLPMSVTGADPVDTVQVEMGKVLFCGIALFFL